MPFRERKFGKFFLNKQGLSGRIIIPDIEAFGLIFGPAGSRMFRSVRDVLKLKAL